MSEISAQKASAREAARQRDGRFGTQSHSEPDGLGRDEIVAAGGQASATTFETGRSAHEFWDNAERAAEYAAHGYPRMGDEVRGKGVHLMSHEHPDLSIEIPSRRAVLDMAIENEDRTFDIPFAVDDADGRTGGWARLTRGRKGQWQVDVIGMDDQDRADRTSEAIRTVLETRRSGVSLDRAGDLYARRNARLDAAGADVMPVSESWVKGVGYDERTHTVTIDLDGRTYGYDAPRKIAEDIAEAESPGRVYNAILKREYPAATKIDQCPDCGRHTRDVSAHRCRIERTAPSTDTRRPRPRTPAQVLERTGRMSPTRSGGVFTALGRKDATELGRSMSAAQLAHAGSSGPSNRNALTVAAMNDNVEVSGHFTNDGVLEVDQVLLHSQARTAREADAHARSLGLSASRAPSVALVDAPWRKGRKCWALTWKNAS